MGSGSAYTERKVTSRSCPSRANPPVSGGTWRANLGRGRSGAGAVSNWARGGLHPRGRRNYLWVSWLAVKLLAGNAVSRVLRGLQSEFPSWQRP